MSENLARILTETAAKHGDRTAFKLDDIELSYSILDEASAPRASSRATAWG
jgi:non-ribosomal peptide synthetase component E (peptide arylation enzyme)